MTRPLIDEVWSPVANLSRFITITKDADKVYTHNALIWNGKLWIFCGQGAGGTAHVVIILSYNLTTGVLTEEYNSAIGIATANCIWRDGVVFNNALYAAFTGQVSGPLNRGGVWKYNSTGSMTEGLNTYATDPPGLRGMYKLCVFNGYLYAGGGEDDVLATLYRSATGDSGSWSVCATFPGYSWVRGMAVWNNELWVGTKKNASLWHGDGVTFSKVSNWPAEALYQAKELIPYQGKLYIGCVNTGTGSFNAKVYSYDGSTFKTEINLPLDHEVFHGDVLNGKLYFTTRVDDNAQDASHMSQLPNGGAVIVTDGVNWRTAFRDTGTNFNHIHWVKGNGNDLYMSGTNTYLKNVYLWKSRNQRPAI